MALPHTVAIDGPGGSGKSSVAAVVARDLDYLFVDTGAFYRAVTLAALRQGKTEPDEATLTDIARHCDMDITPERDADNRDYTILLDGEDVTNKIRDPGVEAHVSRVSAIAGVREVLNEKYRALAARGRVIMVGRDIGTIVLPHADLKIYLDASPEARAERRYKQRVEAGLPADYDQILAALRARDAHDSQREVAPLTIAPDAYHFFTDDLDVAGVVHFLKQIILDWQKAP
ncbi:MAG TPA: (d)CMP kinase [Aggregatilineales bacterium]|nr:(d)CMP kinase [Aggregatilineales bacterium]